MPAISQQRALWLADHVLPHEPALRAWLRTRRVARLEVDDIVQESYAVLTALDNVAHVNNPRAYLFTVARSVILQHVRRARIVSIESVADIERLGIVPDELSPERHAVSHQELRRIGVLIAGLPAKCRQVFVLRKIEGLSQREVAARMGVSENTVEKHVGKGLRMLMAGMGEDRPGAEAPSPRRNAGGGDVETTRQREY